MQASITPDQPQTPDYRPNVGLCLVHPETGKVFVGERSRHPGAWQMPQGGLDEGEDVLACLHREICEETAIAPKDYRITKSMPHWLCYDFTDGHKLRYPEREFKVKGQCQLWFLGEYIGDGAIDLSKAEDREFSRWQWMPAEELLAQIVPFKQEVYAEMLGYFGLLKKPQGS